MKIEFNKTPGPKALGFEELTRGEVYENDGKWYIRGVNCMILLNNGDIYIDSYWSGGNGRGTTFYKCDAKLVVTRPACIEQY